MKIEAGRMITEAMVAQRDRDFLSLVVFDTIVGGWNRMSAKLADKGWITPFSQANTIDQAMAQAVEAQDQIDLKRPERVFDVADEQWKRPSE